MLKIKKAITLLLIIILLSFIFYSLGLNAILATPNHWLLMGGLISTFLLTVVMAYWQYINQ